MSAQQHYAERLLELKRSQIASELEQQGYHVDLETRLDGKWADLIATRLGETLVYEFNVPATLHSNSDQIQQLRRAAKEKGYDFRLVVVTPPKRVDVTVDGLNRALYDALIDQLADSNLASLASHVIVEDVSDVEISSLNVHGEFSEIAGHGVVGVRLDSGGAQVRDSAPSYDILPFDFDVTLNSEHQVTTTRTLRVDISSFGE